MFHSKRRQSFPQVSTAHHHSWHRKADTGMCVKHIVQFIRQARYQPRLQYRIALLLAGLLVVALGYAFLFHGLIVYAPLALR